MNTGGFESRIFLHPKIKNKKNKNLWKACNKGLPTKGWIAQVHFFTPKQCELCSCASKTTSHLFFQCPFVFDILHQLDVDFGWPQIPVSANLDSFRANLEVCLDALGLS